MFCCRAHFQSCPSLSLESSLISQHIALLERQQPIEVRSSMNDLCVSSSSSPWREAVSSSIPPLRFVAKTICPLPAREHLSPIFLCPGMWSHVVRGRPRAHLQLGDGRTPSWAFQWVWRIWFTATSSACLAMWPNSPNLCLWTIDENYCVNYWLENIGILCCCTKWSDAENLIWCSKPSTV